MGGLLRLLWMAFVLVLALASLSFVIGIGTPSTGPVEKVALLGLIALCFCLAARSDAFVTRWQARLQRR